MVIFSITRSGRVKKKKNFFKRTFSLPVFLFPVIKRGEKVSGFVFFPKGERENVKKIIKKRKKIFSSFREVF